MAMLRIARHVLSHTKLPGRYLTAELVAKLFVPASKLVEGEIGGYYYEFDFRDLLQREMYFGLYDPVETALMSTLLGEGDVFFDLGANVGYYTLHASRLVGHTGTVHAFEPIPDNVQRLSSAVKHNGINNVCVNQVAVGDTEGTLSLYVGDESLGNSGWASIVPSEQRPHALTVRKLTVETYMVEHDVKSIRLMKLDVEGAEPEVIAGMKSLLQRNDSPDLLCEVNPWLLARRGLDSTAITRALDVYGYRMIPVGRGVAAKIEPSRVITKLVNLFCSKREF